MSEKTAEVQEKVQTVTDESAPKGGALSAASGAKGLAKTKREKHEGRVRIGKSAFAWVMAIFYLFPVYWMVCTAFKTQMETFAQPPHLIPQNPTLASFRVAFSDNFGIWKALGNSAIIAAGCLVLTLLFAIPAAYAIARMRSTITTGMLILLSVVQLLPAIAISIPMFVLFRHAGMVNTLPSIILADVTGTLPFAIIMLRPFFKQFPKEVEEAARLDGLGIIGTIVRVVIPTIRPGVIMIGSFSFLMTWGEFTFALTLLTKADLQPLTGALNRLIGQYATNWNDLMAVATVIAIPVLILFVALQKYIVAGLAGGATKG